MGLRVGEILAISLPIVSFFDQAFIYNNSNFILILFLVTFYFYVYPMSPLQNYYIEELRKYTVLVVGSWLTVIIAGELDNVVKDVYAFEYHF